MSANTAAEVFPPGEYLRDELDERGWTVTEFAQILGRPIQAISEILNGKKEITTETAIDLATALGTSAELWLNLQNAYRLHHLRKAPAQQAPILRRRRLRAYGPVAEMRRRGWLPDTDDLDAMEAGVRELFGIESLTDSPDFAFAARRANSSDPVSAIQVAWVAQVKRLADPRPAASLDLDELAAYAAALPRRLRDGPSSLFGLAEELAALGVVLVVEEPLKSSKLDGAALFCPGGRAVVGLTARYDRFDIFVFTLMHELAHVVLGHVTPSTEPLIDEGVDGNPSVVASMEDQADELAGEWIFPGGFVTPTGAVSSAVIAVLAAQYGVHPSLVIGRLQRDGVIDWSRFRNHIPKVRPYTSWFRS